MKLYKYKLTLSLFLSILLFPSLSATDIDETLHFRSIEYHEDANNGSQHDDYIDPVLTTGSGNDIIAVEDDISGSRTLNTGAGNDTIRVYGSLQHDSVINTGDGDNSVVIYGKFTDNSRISTGDGNDTISIENAMYDESSIDSGNGDDSLTLDKIKDFTIIAGSGNDTLKIMKISSRKGTIDTGAGNDTLYIKSVSGSYDNGSVTLGLGTDSLTVDDSLSGTQTVFDGADGYDTLFLSKVTEKKWNKEIKNIFTSFEQVTLKDGVVLELEQSETPLVEPDTSEQNQTVEATKGEIPPTEPEIPEQSQTVEVINGYTLPPEPDETLNNSTLLGIDSNNNGIRDDVERKIFVAYNRPIEQAFMMQSARLYPQTLEDPVAAGESEELRAEEWKEASCGSYLRRNSIRIVNTVGFLEDAYFNTRERMRAYMEFNQAMSGGTYSMPIHDKDVKKENCDFNVTKMLEMN